MLWASKIVFHRPTADKLFFKVCHCSIKQKSHITLHMTYPPYAVLNDVSLDLKLMANYLAEFMIPPTEIIHKFCVIF
jgi:hypothetical protein